MERTQVIMNCSSLRTLNVLWNGVLEKALAILSADHGLDHLERDVLLDCVDEGDAGDRQAASEEPVHVLEGVELVGRQIDYGPQRGDEGFSQ